MRKLCVALLGLLACVAPAAAQQAQAQPAKPQPAAVDKAKLLDTHLANWEARMKEISTLEMRDIERTDKDNQLKYVSKLRGFALYSKPNLATLYLVREDKKDIYERYICTGAALYQYAPAEKKIYIHQLPAKKDGKQLGDENFLNFIFGMTAAEAKKRYGLQIAAGKENDPYYVYLDVQPREDRDKHDFQVARLVLNKDTYLPRQVWFRAPNGDETTWNIPHARSGVQIDRRNFQAPTLDKGWSWARGAKAGENSQKSPRIVRPQQR